MASKFSLSAGFAHLNSCLELFSEELRSADIVLANFFQLPITEKGDESHIAESLNVVKVSGKVAIDQSIAAFKDMFLQENQSGKVIKRYPGILLVNDPDKTLENRIRQINQAKLSFKQQILKITNNDARFEAVHAAVPGLITLAAYRQIHFECDNPHSVRFTWMQKHSTKTLTKSIALEMLERSSSYSNPRMIDQATWQSMVGQEQARVASLSANAKLRIRRPTRVSPEVNVRFSATHRYHVSGALPFIVLNPTPDIIIGDLPDYQKSSSDPRKKDYNYLVDRIYLEENK
ncbi:DNA replication terminus site-binding protein [Pseudoalteromonas fenneropenaei]|uniref:DNA replication terminus site-binding protein n=1 Tax=Pseudoalteromonas fenneropenaei TaxID=1737459 RepID=A0ABV7CIY4_9GAMM